jgi:hypothetical protein
MQLLQVCKVGAQAGLLHLGPPRGCLAGAQQQLCLAGLQSCQQQLSVLALEEVMLGQLQCSQAVAVAVMAHKKEWP